MVDTAGQWSASHHGVGAGWMKEAREIRSLSLRVLLSHAIKASLEMDNQPESK